MVTIWFGNASATFHTDYTPSPLDVFYMAGQRWFPLRTKR